MITWHLSHHLITVFILLAHLLTELFDFLVFLVCLGFSYLYILHINLLSTIN